jgi:hypothetical protein
MLLAFTLGLGVFPLCVAPKRYIDAIASTSLPRVGLSLSCRWGSRQYTLCNDDSFRNNVYRVGPNFSITTAFLHQRQKMQTALHKIVYNVILLNIKYIYSPSPLQESIVFEHFDDVSSSENHSIERTIIPKQSIKAINKSDPKASCSFWCQQEEVPGSQYIRRYSSTI